MSLPYPKRRKQLARCKVAIDIVEEKCNDRWSRHPRPCGKSRWQPGRMSLTTFPIDPLCWPPGSTCKHVISRDQGSTGKNVFVTSCWDEAVAHGNQDKACSLSAADSDQASVRKQENISCHPKEQTTGRVRCHGYCPSSGDCCVNIRPSTPSSRQKKLRTPQHAARRESRQNCSTHPNASWFGLHQPIKSRMQRAHIYH